MDLDKHFKVGDRAIMLRVMIGESCALVEHHASVDAVSAHVVNLSVDGTEVIPYDKRKDFLSATTKTEGAYVRGYNEIDYCHTNYEGEGPYHRFETITRDDEVLEGHQKLYDYILGVLDEKDKKTFVEIFSFMDNERFIEDFEFLVQQCKQITPATSLQFLVPPNMRDTHLWRLSFANAVKDLLYSSGYEAIGDKFAAEASEGIKSSGKLIVSAARHVRIEMGDEEWAVRESKAFGAKQPAGDISAAENW